MHGKIFYQTNIKEFAKYDRPTWWYVIAGLVFVVLLGYSIATFNFLFALIVIIAAILVMMTSMREPRDLEVAITEDGVEVGPDFFAWRAVRNFWMVYEPGEIKALYLNFRNIVRPRLSVPLDDTDPVELRAALLRYIPEDSAREDEPLSDYIGKVLKI